MFQRFKGIAGNIDNFLDSKLAEEQTRQRSSSPARPARRQGVRPASGTRSSSVRSRDDADKAGRGKGPDPSEFVIEDDDDETPSRAATPQPKPVVSVDPDDKTSQSTSDTTTNETIESPTKSNLSDETALPSSASAQLPDDVQRKLRKLSKLESKYAELLRSYRIAHARVSAIDPFEATLREHTPLSSISEPSALVEYLSNLNLKGDMVMDELKRISGERDGIKTRLEEAQTQLKDRQTEADSLRKERDQLLTRSDDKPTETNINDNTATASNEKLSALEMQISNVESLLDKHYSRAAADNEQSLPDRIQNLCSAHDTIRSEKTIVDEQLSQIQTAIDESKDFEPADEGTAVTYPIKVHALSQRLALAKDRQEHAERQLLEMRESRPEPVPEKDAHIDGDALHRVENDRDAAYQFIADSGLVSLTANLESKESTTTQDVASITAPASEATETAIAASSKKKNKNKKKTNAAKTAQAEADMVETVESLQQPQPETSTIVAKSPIMGTGLNDAQLAAIRTRIGQTHAPASSDIQELRTRLESKESQIQELHADIASKQASIERLTKLQKGEEALNEEIESLRESLSLIGNDHVAVKDKCKVLQTERDSLQTLLDEMQSGKGTDAGTAQKVQDLEKEKTRLETLVTTHTKEIETLRKSALATQRLHDEAMAENTARLEKHTAESEALQKDLSAANSLAQSRFKDMTALREHLNTVQPELARMKKTLEESKATSGDIQQLERRVEALDAKIKTLTTSVTEKETTIKALNEKLRKESEKNGLLQSNLEGKQRAKDKAEALQKEASEASVKAASALASAQSELAQTKERLSSLEKQSNKLENSAKTAKEELDLRSAQQASAQSLMDSMQDQTRELATQMKELQERCESLEEERADALRLLGERSREGETIRRLLSDVEARAETKIKDMKDRLTLTIEERERAEEDANTAARRRTKVVDDLRSQLDDANKLRVSAQEQLHLLEKRESQTALTMSELQNSVARTRNEMREVQISSEQLREALEASERQMKEMDTDRAQITRQLEERDRRLEKLQKGSKSMAEEWRNLQQAKGRGAGSSSTRSSIESHRVTSPGARRSSTIGTAGAMSTAGTAGTDGQAALDYVYLKNILLQFLEQRDKKHQMQLVPVLGMLLHFDRADEQKWMSAITAK